MEKLISLASSPISQCLLCDSPGEFSSNINIEVIILSPVFPKYSVFLRTYEAFLFILFLLFKSTWMLASLCWGKRGYSLAYWRLFSGNKKPIWGGENSTTERPMHVTNFGIKVELGMLVPVSHIFCGTISVSETKTLYSLWIPELLKFYSVNFYSYFVCHRKLLDPVWTLFLLFKRFKGVSLSWYWEIFFSMKMVGDRS